MTLYIVLISALNYSTHPLRFLFISDHCQLHLLLCGSRFKRIHISRFSNSLFYTAMVTNYDSVELLGLFQTGLRLAPLEDSYSALKCNC